MYNVYIARDGLKVYIGYCKNNAKQNFYRNCKNNGWDYKKFKITVVDKTEIKSIAQTVVIYDSILAFVYGYKNISKRNSKQIQKEYERLIKGA